MIIYIADFNLPNNSAYSQQVLKMCDAFCDQEKNIVLFVNSLNDKYSFGKIKKDYLLKNNFKILPVKFKSNYNFFSNLLFSILVLFKIMKVKKKAKLIFTRVFLVSIFLSIFKIKHILEIHNETSGITKFFFNYYYFFNNKKFIKIIYIHKNLKKYFSVLNKCNSLVLDDAVDHRDFKKKTKKIESSCVYTGSLSPGKGLEVIYELAKKLKNTKFFVYGDKRLINNYTKNFPKNIFFKNSVKYNKIPSILKSHKILLMPYLEISKGRSKKINLSKYMSPLKLFDYLAAGRIIFASDLKVYDHVLKNKYNCIKFSLINLNSCANNIKKVLNNYNKYKLIRKNAMKTSYKFSWINRTKKILYLNEKY